MLFPIIVSSIGYTAFIYILLVRLFNPLQIRVETGIVVGTIGFLIGTIFLLQTIGSLLEDIRSAIRK